MQEVWGWLGGNSSPWDAIGSIGVILIAVVLGVALSRKARATIAQARVERPRAEAASGQSAASVPSADRETFPNILVDAARTREGVVKKDTIGILNVGGGNAKELRLRCRDESSSYEIPLDKKDLMIRDILPVPFDSSRRAFSRFQLSFKSDFGTQYVLEFEWDSNDSRAVNEKLTVVPSGSPVS